MAEEEKRKSFVYNKKNINQKVEEIKEDESNTFFAKLPKNYAISLKKYVGGTAGRRALVGAFLGCLLFKGVDMGLDYLGIDFGKEEPVAVVTEPVAPKKIEVPAKYDARTVAIDYLTKNKETIDSVFQDKGAQDALIKFINPKGKKVAIPINKVYKFRNSTFEDRVYSAARAASLYEYGANADEWKISTCGGSYIESDRTTGCQERQKPSTKKRGSLNIN